MKFKKLIKDHNKVDRELKRILGQVKDGTIEKEAGRIIKQVGKVVAATGTTINELGDKIENRKNSFRPTI